MKSSKKAPGIGNARAPTRGGTISTVPSVPALKGAVVSKVLDDSAGSKPKSRGTSARETGETGSSVKIEHSAPLARIASKVTNGKIVASLNRARSCPWNSDRAKMKPAYYDLLSIMVAEGYALDEIADALNMTVECLHNHRLATKEVRQILKPVRHVRKSGRITYTLSMCDKVISEGKRGTTYTGIACALGVSFDTVEFWCQNFGEFKQAMSSARAECQAFWESKGKARTFGTTPYFNATSYIFAMKNMFPDDYRDARHLEVNGTLADALREIAQDRVAGDGALVIEGQAEVVDRSD